SSKVLGKIQADARALPWCRYSGRPCKLRARMHADLASRSRGVRSVHGPMLGVGTRCGRCLHRCRYVSVLRMPEGMPTVQEQVLIKGDKSMQPKDPSKRLAGGSWVLPVIGLAGTVAAILTGFARMGTESQWKTALVSVGAGLVVVGIALMLLRTATRVR